MTIIRILTAPLSDPHVSISGIDGTLDGSVAGGAPVDLAPGVHSLAQCPTDEPIVFSVTPEGGLEVASPSAGMATAAGSTLTVHGVAISLDVSAASVRAALGTRATPLLSTDGPTSLRVLPGRWRLSVGPYGLSAAEIVVTSAGTAHVDPSHTAYIDGSGSSALAFHPVSVEIDGTALAHWLLLAGSVEDTFDPPTAIAEHQLLPGGPYAVQPGSGVVADMVITVEPDGSVEVPGKCHGFARTVGNRVVIDGYDVTWDARDLAHGVGSWMVAKPALEVGAGGTVTYRTIPCPDLMLQMASRPVDGKIALTTEGSLDYSTAGDGYLDGRHTATLTMLGHPLVIDARHSGHELAGLPQIGWGATSPHFVIGSVMPWAGSCDIQTTDGLAAAAIRLREDGTVDLLEAIPGLTVATAPRVRFAS